MPRLELSVDGETFRALATGPPEGPVAIFLHGFPDLPSSWAPVMQRFAARGYRCVAPWTRGYPPSTTAGPFSLERLADDALGFIDAVSPDRSAFLLGHDWGAAATWYALERGPARVAAAVAVSVPHPKRFARAALSSPAQLWRSRYMLALQARSIDRRGIERLWRRWSPGFEPPANHLDEVARTIRDGRDAPLEYYRDARRSLGRFLRGSARIDVPLLYLHGRNDRCIDAGAASHPSRHVSGPYRAEIIEGAGHFVTLEAPERIATLALRFFEAHADPFKAPPDRRGSG